MGSGANGQLDLKERLRTPLLLGVIRVGLEEARSGTRLQDLSAGDLNDKIWDVFIERRWVFENKNAIPSIHCLIVQTKPEGALG
ncbi:MAG: hypothetical protein IPK17_37420 [Chloroflexi bacterium]|uniref:hypothetical protein n=1 Tax=Candidatus Flexifilum breve TaxID=3140694 RepID=UPI003135F676|nr:hypothetical protein [Chloroflexota bacterium]